jgi:hypothetical protein
MATSFVDMINNTVADENAPPRPRFTNPPPPINRKDAPGSAKRCHGMKPEVLDFEGSNPSRVPQQRASLPIGYGSGGGTRDSRKYSPY